MRTCNRVVWSVFFAVLANVASGVGVVPSPVSAATPQDVCALQISAGEAGAENLSSLQGLMGIASGEETSSPEMGVGPVHQATADKQRVCAPRISFLPMPMLVRAQLPDVDAGPARPVPQESFVAPPCAPSALLPLGPHAPPFLA